MGLSGHCLCGAVKYTVSGEPLIVGYDHCDDCQRQTGSTYCTSQSYPADIVHGRHLATTKLKPLQL